MHVLLADKNITESKLKNDYTLKNKFFFFSHFPILVTKLKSNYKLPVKNNNPI